MRDNFRQQARIHPSAPTLRPLTILFIYSSYIFIFCWEIWGPGIHACDMLTFTSHKNSNAGQGDLPMEMPLPMATLPRVT